MWTYIVSSTSSVWSFTRMYIMGRASNKPTANSVQVDMNIFINLGQTIKTRPELYVAKSWLTGFSEHLLSRSLLLLLTVGICLKAGGQKNDEYTVQHPLQNPVRKASFAGSLDMAPISQYEVVCHIASRTPNKT